MATWHTPTIVPSGCRYQALIAIPVEQCPACGKWMPDCYRSSLLSCGDHYGAADKGGNTMDAQLKRARMVWRSDAQDSNRKFICEQCKEQDKADFICAICKQNRPSSASKFSVGDPAEYLCSICYSSVPAKEWDRREEELRESHKYDYD